MSKTLGKTTAVWFGELSLSAAWSCRQEMKPSFPFPPHPLYTTP